MLCLKVGLVRTPYTIFTPQYFIPTGSTIMAYGTDPLQMPELGLRKGQNLGLS